ncbi:MAG TPA: S9 family peptidase [Labilithrix sp.]|nr:S9 family peptidase [Labilithrix sp.]
MSQRLASALLLSVLAACGEDTPPPKAPVATPPVVAPPVVSAAPPPRAPVAPVALEEYFKIRRVPAFSRSGLPMLSFSADETKVAYATDETGRIDIWVKPISGDGKAVQVTHVEGFVHSFAFSPKEDVLVFEADRGGDELPRLYATDSKGAPPRELVPELPAGRRSQFVDWARNGATFLYLANSRDEKDLDLLEYDLKTKKSTLVWQAAGSVSFAATNVEHTRFALVDTHSDANTDVYVIDRNEKKPTLLTQHTGDILFQPAVFARDGKSLFLTSDEEGEFTSLFAAALPGGKRTRVLAEKWDVDGADLSRTGKYFVTEVNENGVPKLVVSEKGKPIALPPVPTKAGAWHAVTFSNTDRYLGVSLVSDTAPSNTYVIDLKTNAATALADPLPESLRGRAMVAGEAVEIPSFDGKKVPAFLYRPAGVTGPVPAIIDVHGGPTAQSRRTFSPFRQYAASKGYAVLVPNVRGSTGYGKTYTRLDNLDLGGGPLKDVVACKRWLVANASVAADKVVVFGGSYGGYMALVAEAFAPDEFAANVDFFGVSDLKTLVESFPPYWASAASYIHQKFGDPKNPAHAAYQHDRSPIHFVGQMKKPLLVVQGDKDARVKKEQSDRIVQGLRERKVPVHYLILENEGHGFTKTENNLRALKLTDRFLDRYIFGDATVTDLP